MASIELSSSQIFPQVVMEAAAPQDTLPEMPTVDPSRIGYARSAAKTQKLVKIIFVLVAISFSIVGLSYALLSYSIIPLYTFVQISALGCLPLSIGIPMLLILLLSPYFFPNDGNNRWYYQDKRKAFKDHLMQKLSSQTLPKYCNDLDYTPFSLEDITQLPSDLDIILYDPLGLGKNGQSIYQNYMRLLEFIRSKRMWILPASTGIQTALSSEELTQPRSFSQSLELLTAKLSEITTIDQHLTGDGEERYETLSTYRIVQILFILAKVQKEFPLLSEEEKNEHRLAFDRIQLQSSHFLTTLKNRGNTNFITFNQFLRLKNALLEELRN